VKTYTWVVTVNLPENLTPDEVHHITTALWAQIAEPVIGTDKDGNLIECEGQDPFVTVFVEQVQVYSCRSCGSTALLPSDSQFCPVCGTGVDGGVG
jgi:hypothetical protein